MIKTSQPVQPDDDAPLGAADEETPGKDATESITMTRGKSKHSGHVHFHIPADATPDELEQLVSYIKHLHSKLHAGEAEPAPDDAEKRSGARLRKYDAEEMRRRAVDELGYTYEPASDKFETEGFVVSKHPGHEQRYHALKLTAGDISKYIEDKKEFVSKTPGAHYGAWFDANTGEVVLDVSHLAKDMDEARQLCYEHDQDAFYDLSTHKSHYVFAHDGHPPAPGTVIPHFIWQPDSKTWTEDPADPPKQAAEMPAFMKFLADEEAQKPTGYCSTCLGTGNVLTQDDDGVEHYDDCPQCQGTGVEPEPAESDPSKPKPTSIPTNVPWPTSNPWAENDAADMMDLVASARFTKRGLNIMETNKIDLTKAMGVFSRANTAAVTLNGQVYVVGLHKSPKTGLWSSIVKLDSMNGKMVAMRDGIPFRSQALAFAKQAIVRKAQTILPLRGVQPTPRNFLAKERAKAENQISAFLGKPVVIDKLSIQSGGTTIGTLSTKSGVAVAIFEDAVTAGPIDQPEFPADMPKGEVDHPEEEFAYAALMAVNLNKGPQDDASAIQEFVGKNKAALSEEDVAALSKPISNQDDSKALFPTLKAISENQEYPQPVQQQAQALLGSIGKIVFTREGLTKVADANYFLRDVQFDSLVRDSELLLPANGWYEVKTVEKGMDVIAFKSDGTVDQTYALSFQNDAAEKAYRREFEKAVSIGEWQTPNKSQVSDKSTELNAPIEYEGAGHPSIFGVVFSNSRGWLAQVHQGVPPGKVIAEAPDAFKTKEQAQAWVKTWAEEEPSAAKLAKGVGNMQGAQFDSYLKVTYDQTGHEPDKLQLISMGEGNVLFETETTPDSNVDATAKKVFSWAEEHGLTVAPYKASKTEHRPTGKVAKAEVTAEARAQDFLRRYKGRKSMMFAGDLETAIGGKRWSEVADLIESLAADEEPDTQETFFRYADSIRQLGEAEMDESKPGEAAKVSKFFTSRYGGGKQLSVSSHRQEDGSTLVLFSVEGKVVGKKALKPTNMDEGWDAENEAENLSDAFLSSGKLPPGAEPVKQVTEEPEEKVAKSGVEDDDENQGPTCSMCGGPLMVLGQLGSLTHLRCQNCGMQSSMPTEKFSSLYGSPDESETEEKVAKVERNMPDQELPESKELIAAFLEQDADKATEATDKLIAAGYYKPYMSSMKRLIRGGQWNDIQHFLESQDGFGWTLTIGDYTTPAKKVAKAKGKFPLATAAQQPNKGIEGEVKGVKTTDLDSAKPSPVDDTKPIDLESVTIDTSEWKKDKGREPSPLDRGVWTFLIGSKRETAELVHYTGIFSAASATARAYAAGNGETKVTLVVGTTKLEDGGLEANTSNRFLGKAAQIPTLTKDTKAMTAGEINRILDKIDVLDSALTQEFIDAGRGEERPSDWQNMKDDPLVQRHNALLELRWKLNNEIEARYGPGAPDRMPKGFKPRTSYRLAASDAMGKATVGTWKQERPAVGEQEDTGVLFARIRLEDVANPKGKALMGIVRPTMDGKKWTAAVKQGGSTPAIGEILEESKDVFDSPDEAKAWVERWAEIEDTNKVAKVTNALGKVGKAFDLVTTTLNNGTVVLARNDPGSSSGVSAVVYVNLTQANKRCELLQAQGVKCHVYDRHGPAKYIQIESADEAEKVAKTEPAYPVEGMETRQVTCPYCKFTGSALIPKSVIQHKEGFRLYCDKCRKSFVYNTVDSGGEAGKVAKAGGTDWLMRGDDTWLKMTETEDEENGTTRYVQRVSPSGSGFKASITVSYNGQAQESESSQKDGFKTSQDARDWVDDVLAGDAEKIATEKVSFTTGCLDPAKLTVLPPPKRCPKCGNRDIVRDGNNIYWHCGNYGTSCDWRLEIYR